MLALAPFSLGGRSAAKIGTECLLYNREKSFETNIHYYDIRNVLLPLLHLLLLLLPSLCLPCAFPKFMGTCCSLSGPSQCPP